MCALDSILEELGSSLHNRSRWIASLAAPSLMLESARSKRFLSTHLFLQTWPTCCLAGLKTVSSIVPCSYTERQKDWQQKENMESNNSSTVVWLSGIWRPPQFWNFDPCCYGMLSDESRLLKTAAVKIDFPPLSHRQQILSKTEPISVISIKRSEMVLAACTSMCHILSTLAWQISKYLIIHM